ncbi:MAG: CRTAC1 family protein [Puniceicoccaceae bacterium]
MASLLITGQALPGGAGKEGQETVQAPTVFVESHDVIDFEDRSRRKWDNPLIADLDQDGWMDVLITEHGLHALLYWNDEGTFSEPVEIVTGDTHGTSVADLDRDGRMDLIISPGGGGGNKPSTPFVYHVRKDRSIEEGNFDSYFEKSRGRATKLVDINNDGDLDLILTAFPLKEQTEGANHLYASAEEGEFTFLGNLPQTAWMSFRALVTDYDQDGVIDILFYGGDNMLLARGGEGFDFDNVTVDVLGELRHTDFVSSISEIDFDNDGDFDLFLTRADYPFDPKTYFDECHGRFAFFTRFKPFLYEDLKIEGDFKMENLQTAYPHHDVFLGEDKRLLTFDVDKHGHKDFSLKASEAAGWPEERADKGLYIGYVGEEAWRIGGHTNSPTTGVVHNVVSQPEVTGNADMPARLFENRDGVFVDVTEELGVSIPEQASSAAVGDFNNDGWTDIIVIRHGDPSKTTKQILLLNQGGKTFTESTNHGIHSAELGATGGGAEAFDYDQDGDLDLIYSNERGRWHLFTNSLPESEKGNYLIVRVGTSPSGKAPANGAVLELKAGGNVYRRVVGSSSSAFGHNVDTHLHLGLGECSVVDSAIITWSNGEQKELVIEGVNRVIE